MFPEKLPWHRNFWRRAFRWLFRNVSAWTAAIGTSLVCAIPYFRFIKETRPNMRPITFTTWFIQKVIGINRKAYWPMHFTSTFSGWVRYAVVGIGSSPGLAPGCYIQAIGHLYIGNYTGLGPNVGIITANHSILDLRKWVQGEVRIGDYCWIGMNSTILPGVVLGDFTIVAAGSVVTDPFPEGYCVLMGNPAKVVKRYDSPEVRNHFVRYKDPCEYNGYIKASRFAQYRRTELSI
jgi:acetyltransferase-like isoleucine patch superfamily enzyme